MVLSQSRVDALQCRVARPERNERAYREKVHVDGHITGYLLSQPTLVTMCHLSPVAFLPLPSSKFIPPQGLLASLDIKSLLPLRAPDNSYGGMAKRTGGPSLKS